MPLVMLDAYPDGQVIINSDDIISVERGLGGVEILLRSKPGLIYLPHSSVAEVADAIRHRDNIVQPGAGQN